MKVKMIYIMRENADFEYERVLVPKQITSADVACWILMGLMYVLYCAIAVCIIGGLGYNLWLLIKPLF